MKRVAHALSLAGGRMSASARLLPGFLIAGAQRCGTTALYRALSTHPAILKPLFRKGIHYFDMDYSRDISWYRAHFPLMTTARLVQRRFGVEPLTFESSPYYLFHPRCAERIAADLPGVRIIVLLRDPVERAYSAWAHEYARGFEHLPFDQAVAAEPARLDGADARLSAEPYGASHAHRHHAYVARGQYAGQLERLARHVGRDRILVLDSWFRAPAESYERVLDFLGLPRMGTPRFTRENARPRTPLEPAERDALAARFAESDAALAPWLGGPPSWA